LGRSSHALWESAAVPDQAAGVDDAAAIIAAPPLPSNRHAVRARSERGNDPVMPVLSQAPQRGPTLVSRRLARILLAAVLLGLVAVPAPVTAETGRPAGRGSGRNVGAWLVKFRPDVAPAAASQAVALPGVTEVGRLDDLATRVISIPDGRRDAVVRQLTADPRVVSVEPDELAQATLTPSDPRWSREWNMRKIRAPEAWNMTLGSATTMIAVIDTGVDPRQPDLRGRVLKGWDFQNDDGNAMDDNGHGTAVAGVAAAAGNDRVGIAGMCWKCVVLPVKVLNASGSGTHSNIAAGIIWAANRGADIINLSLASPRDTTVVADAVAHARRKGAVVIAAAGNEGSRQRFYPAGYSGVISVAGSSGADVLYHWSNRGSWIKVAAPGCAHTGKPGPAWTMWCGTSFATPAVAGTAALIKSLRPAISRSQLERVLLSSTVRIPGVANGRIDAARALRRTVSVIPGTPTTPAPTATPRVTPRPTATPRVTPRPTATPRATPRPTPSPTATPRPTPTPTPRPPTPTPKPTATATPTPRVTSYDWSGDLSEDDQRDDEWVWLSGETYIVLEWWSDAGLELQVEDVTGNDVLEVYDDDGWRDEEVWLDPGWYEVTVSQWSDDWTEYRIRIN
jgi:subtilisin family serine protease